MHPYKKKIQNKKKFLKIKEQKNWNQCPPRPRRGSGFD